MPISPVYSVATKIWGYLTTPAPSPASCHDDDKEPTKGIITGPGLPTCQSQTCDDGGLPQLSDAATKTDSETIIDKTDAGSIIIFPKDENGNYILAGDVFPLVWDGSAVWVTPDANFCSGRVPGKGIKDLNLWFEVGVDFTALPGIPADVDFEQGALVNMAPADTEQSCPNAPYQNFAVCPDDVANRILLYFGGWKLSGLDKSDVSIVIDPADPNYTAYPTELIVDPNILLTDPASAPAVGVVKGANPNPTIIGIAPNFNEEDYFSVCLNNFKFALVGNDLGSKGEMAQFYQTRFSILIKGIERP